MPGLRPFFSALLERSCVTVAGGRLILGPPNGLQPAGRPGCHGLCILEIGHYQATLLKQSRTASEIDVRHESRPNIIGKRSDGALNGCGTLETMRHAMKRCDVSSCPEALQQWSLTSPHKWTTRSKDATRGSWPYY